MTILTNAASNFLLAMFAVWLMRDAADRHNLLGLLIMLAASLAATAMGITELLTWTVTR